MMFLRIAMFHKAISEAKLNLEVGSRIRTTIQSFSSGDETEVTIKTAGAKIENSCRGIKIFGGSSLNMNIFSNKELNPQLGQLFLFTKKFEVPFYVTNLIMLVEPETKFIFINNTNKVSQDLIEDIKSDLPVGLNVEQFDGSSNGLKNAISTANRYKSKVRIISFVKPTAYDLESVTNKDVTLIYVKPYSSQSGSKYNNIGNLTYYTILGYGEKVEREGVSFYIGLSTLTAASVSDKEIYDCNFNNLLKKLHYSIKIYSLRYSKLVTDSELSPDCLTGLERALPLLKDTDVSVNNIRAERIEDIKLNEIKDLYDELNKINSFNEGLIYNSCPEMY